MVRVLGCERMLRTRSHPKMRGFTTEIPNEPSYPRLSHRAFGYNGEMDLPELPDPTWVDSMPALQAMVGVLADCPIIAVDTESNSLHAFQEQVCLIQFSCPKGDYLVDPLTLRDLSSLGPIFANPSIEKIFHAAEYDVICLKRDFNFTFTNLFDTMVAGRILGRNAVGLASMLEAAFGVALDKHYQRADWALRPLKPAMLSYARFDTYFLIPLRERLKAGLIETHRWVLAQEDFNRLCALNGHSLDNGKDSCWKVTGIQDLDPRRAAVLRELCRYRDGQARAANMPVFKIINNQALLEIAQTCPNYIEELDLLPGLSARQVQRHGRGLLAAVKRGLNAPPLVKPAYERMDEQLATRVEMLRSWRKRTAQDLGVESDVILPRDVMQSIAEANPSCLDELATIMQSSPSRFGQYGHTILRILNR
jgi:ribonuclease D